MRLCLGYSSTWALILIRWLIWRRIGYSIIVEPTPKSRIRIHLKWSVLLVHVYNYSRKPKWYLCLWLWKCTALISNKTLCSKRNDFINKPKWEKCNERTTDPCSWEFNIIMWSTEDNGYRGRCGPLLLFCGMLSRATKQQSHGRRRRRTFENRMTQEVLLQDLFAETLSVRIASHTNNIWADSCIVLPANWD